MNGIIDKIRRLLKLGESTNQHEAELALSKAAELALKHAIDLQALRAEGERARIVEEKFAANKAAHAAAERAARMVCARLFRVRSTVMSLGRTQVGYSYIGHEHNLETAKWAHGFIVEQCGRDLKAFQDGRRKRRVRTSPGAAGQFCEGWAAAVVHRHQAEKEKDPELCCEKAALMVLTETQEVDAHINGMKLGKESESRAREDREALHAGIEAGKRVNVARPLKAGGTLCLPGIPATDGAGAENEGGGR